MSFGTLGDVGDIGVLGDVGVLGALVSIDAYMVVMYTAVFTGRQKPPRVKPSVIGTSVAKNRGLRCPLMSQVNTAVHHVYINTSMLLKAPRTPMTLTAPKALIRTPTAPKAPRTPTSPQAPRNTHVL